MVIEMKKILSLILACALCVAAMPVVSFAETQTTESLFGVITDADGNVVEVLPMPRTTYVNSVYTIPAGGEFISYQYEPSESFYFGFYSVTENGDSITKTGSQLEEIVEMSNTIGGDGRKVWGTLSCTVTEKKIGYFLASGNVSNSGYRYYNGRLKNKSSYSTTVRIIVGIDGDIPL